MDAPSFISSFRAFQRWPAAAVLAIALFVAMELAALALWRPSVVGAGLYGRYSPGYDYGYAENDPQLFREGESFRFYPTEYVNMHAFTIAAQKPENGIRIFTLGGSVPRASGLAPSDSYSKKLEAILNERHPDRHWEVFNLSADGFGTERMLRTLAAMMRFEPDLLVVHPHGTNEFEDEQDARYREELHAGLNGWLLRSRAIVLLKKLEAEHLARKQASLPPADAEALAERDPANVARWMKNMERNLEGLACMAETAAVPAIYVGRAERDADGFRNERVDRLNAPISSMQHYVDSASVLAGKGEPDSLFFDNTHFDVAGHELVARRLAELLEPGRGLYEEILARSSKVHGDLEAECSATVRER